MVSNTSFPLKRGLNLLDYVPVLSSITSAVHLIAGQILTPPQATAPPTPLTQHYYTYLQDRSTMRSVVCLLPVIGNVCIFLYDLAVFLINLPVIYLEDGEIRDIARELDTLGRRTRGLEQPAILEEELTAAVETIRKNITGSKELFLQVIRASTIKTYLPQEHTQQMVLLIRLIPDAWKKDPQFVLAFIDACFTLIGDHTIRVADFLPHNPIFTTGIYADEFSACSETLKIVADPTLWADKTFVEGAICRAGNAMQHAAPEIKKDVLWVCRMMRLYPDSAALLLWHSDPILWQEDELLLAVLAHKRMYINVDRGFNTNTDCFAQLCLKRPLPNTTSDAQLQLFLSAAMAKDASSFIDLAHHANACLDHGKQWRYIMCLLNLAPMHPLFLAPVPTAPQSRPRPRR